MERITITETSKSTFFFKICFWLFHFFAQKMLRKQNQQLLPRPQPQPRLPRPQLLQQPQPQQQRPRQLLFEMVELK